MLCYILSEKDYSYDIIDLNKNFALQLNTSLGNFMKLNKTSEHLLKIHINLLIVQLD